MARVVYRKIIELMLKAVELARSVGITNLLQPGLIKEMIIADILGHQLIHSNAMQMRMPRTTGRRNTSISHARRVVPGKWTVCLKSLLKNAPTP